MVDELAPAGGEEVAARRAAVDVAEPPRDAVDVGDVEKLDRRLGAEVERREDGVGAEARNGESAAVVGVGGSEDFGEGNDAVTFVLVVIVVVVSVVIDVVLSVRVVNEGSEDEFGEDLVGERIGEQIEGGHVAGN